MAVVTMRQLLEAGVHFGHQTRRWNPKMKRFIYGERNGIYIIDLQKTTGAIERTYAFLRDTVAKGGTILFVGTKKQAQESIKDQAERVGMPYVNFRGLGGMLTNFTTMYKRLQRLKELEELVNSEAADVLPKKEMLKLKHERDKLERNLGGIRDMTRVPSAIWVVDTRKEHIAVAEARKLGIPVVAILDTNCDPDEVDYPIPGNDDAIRAGSLLTRIVADAIAEGLRMRATSAGKSGDEGATRAASPVDEEPLAEWERELLEADSAKPAEAAAPAKAEAKAAPAKAEARTEAPAAKAAKPEAKADAPAKPEAPAKAETATSEAPANAEAPATDEAKAEAPATDEAPATSEAKAEPATTAATATPAADEAATDEATPVTTEVAPATAEVDDAEAGAAEKA